MIGVRDRLTRIRNGYGLEVALFSVGLVYFILLGGGRSGEQLTTLRAINLALAGTLVVLWLRNRDHADALDSSVVVGTLAFLATALLSSSLRLSFDPAIQVLGFAALFWYARRLLWRDDGYAALIWIFGGLCIGLSLFYAIEWGSIWLEWARVTGFREMPPLSLPLPGGFYLHRHDVALLIVMLAPSLLIPIGFGRRWEIRVIAAALIAVVLMMDGSRTVVMSALGAAAVVGVVAARRGNWVRLATRLRTRAKILMGGVALAAGAAMVVVAEPFLARALELNTLSARGALWSSALSAWLSDPLTGTGPGTFLFAQFETGYYDVATYFPRNTDGAPFMLLAETGLVGVIGLAVVLGGFLRSRMSTRPGSPLLLFGPAAFLVAGIGQVPADFGFLVAPPLLWLAAAFPREPAVASRRGERRPAPGAIAFRWAAGASLALTALALSSATVAGWAYEEARTAMRSGDLEKAALHLHDAVALDPALALYGRALGAVELARESPDAAVAALERAASAEPRDPVTHRVLALAYLAAGDDAGASESTSTALQLRRSHPFHHAVAALVTRTRGDDDSSDRHIDRFTMVVPWLMGADEWPASLSERRTASDAARLLELWARERDEVLVQLEPALLASMASSDRHREAIHEAAGGLPRTHEALVSLLKCDPHRGYASLSDARTAERANAAYWAVRVMVGRLVAEDVGEDLQLGQIAGLGMRATETFASSGLEEMWAYRRAPLPPISLPFDLPPEDGGLSAWLDDPKAAARAAGVQALATCGDEK